MKREFPDEAAHLLLACHDAVASGRPFDRADLAHALRGVIHAVGRPGFVVTNAEQFRELARKLAPDLGVPTEEPGTTPKPREGDDGSSAGDGSGG
jgi:hypothetical protein